MKQVREVVAVMQAVLRELFDEAAYARFLCRTGVAASRQSYAEFLCEKYGQPRQRCC